MPPPLVRRLPQRPLTIVATASNAPYGHGPISHVSGGPAGPWPRFLNASAAAGSNLVFVDVGCAQTGSELHVCATTEDGNLWHTIRYPDGSWQPFDDLTRAAQGPAGIVAVDCAEIKGELHVCAVDKTGGLFHTVRRRNTRERRGRPSWDGFSRVKEPVGRDLGKFSDVGCVGIGDELHLCGITPPSGVWHAIRRGDGSWDPFFTDLRQVASDPGNPYRVDCAARSSGTNPVVEVLAVVVLADRDGHGLRVQLAQHQRLYSDSWQPGHWVGFTETGLGNLGLVGSYYDVACTNLEDDLHLLVYDLKAKGIRHARGLWKGSGNAIIDVIDAKALGSVPGHVACSPGTAPVSDRPWAGALGKLFARVRSLVP